MEEKNTLPKCCDDITYIINLPCFYFVLEELNVTFQDAYFFFFLISNIWHWAPLPRDRPFIANRDRCSVLATVLAELWYVIYRVTYWYCKNTPI